VRVALSDGKTGDTKMKKNKRGFTLLEIMIVVAIIGLLAAMAMPAVTKARTTSQQRACINNLRQIESGKEQWALENRKVDGDEVVTGEIDQYMRASPTCQGGGTYTYDKVGTAASCAITWPAPHHL
jgi:prepilin-type N-terminal cleavage/methylation domain-containing protein